MDYVDNERRKTTAVPPNQETFGEKENYKYIENGHHQIEMKEK